MKNTLISLIVIILTSCKSSEVSFLELFSENKDINTQEALFEIDSIGNPSMMEYANNNLFICEAFSSPFISVFDWKTGKCINRFGEKGLGPDEFLGFNTLSSFKDKLSVYDNNKRELLFLSCKDNDISYNIKLKLQKDEELFPFKMYAISDTLFVATGIIDGGRFALFNSNDSILKTFGNYPNESESSNSYVDKAFAYQANLAYQNNKKILAVGNLFGEGISFYDINDPLNPKLLIEHIITYPQYTSSSKGDNKSVSFKKDNILGIIDLDTSEEFCIALYSGEVRKRGESWTGGDKLLLFDWNGTPLKIINLKQKYIQAAISEEDVILLGIDAETKGFIIHKFKILDI